MLPWNKWSTKIRHFYITIIIGPGLSMPVYKNGSIALPPLIPAATRGCLPLLLTVCPHTHTLHINVPTPMAWIWGPWAVCLQGEGRGKGWHVASGPEHSDL